MRRQLGCVLSAAAVLVATVLPWSSTAAVGRSGWDTAALALRARRGGAPASPDGPGLPLRVMNVLGLDTD